MDLYMGMLRIVQAVLSIYWYILIATAAISWVPDLADTQLGQFLYRLTEPYLQLFRRYIAPLDLGGVMLDLAFVVGIIVYYFLEQGIMYVLESLLRGLM